MPVKVFGYRDPTDFGTDVGTGGDDTAAIQAAADSGAHHVVIPDGMTFLVSQPIVFNNPIRISGLGAIIQTDPLSGIFSVRSSGFTVKGVTLESPGNTSAAYDPVRSAIDITGTPANRLTDIDIDHVTVRDTPGNGIYMENVDNFQFTDLDIESVGYAGIAGLHVTNGSVYGGKIVGNNTGLPGNANAYGIFWTRRNDASDPISENIDTFGTIVQNFPTWEGLDTHGGKNIKFIGCTIQGCRRGIALIRANNSDGTKIAPSQCQAIGNTIIGSVEDGTNFEGINASGALDGVTVAEYATGLTISDNIIENHGLDEPNRINGGIVTFASKGTKISGNTIRRCAPNGISVNGTSHALRISDNSFEDPFANTAASAACIRVSSGDVTGVISGNTHANGDPVFVATNVANFGVHIPPVSTGVRLEYGPNFFDDVSSLEVNDIGNALTSRPAGIRLNQGTADPLHVMAVTPGGGQGPGDSLSFVATDPYGSVVHRELINRLVERHVSTISAAQAIPDGVWTSVDWGVAVIDDEWPSATATPYTAFALPLAGQWRLDAAANFDANATGDRGVRVLIDATVVDEMIVPAVGSARTTPRVSRDWPISTAATVTVEVFQNSGGNLDINPVRTMFGIRRVGEI